MEKETYFKEEIETVLNDQVGEALEILGCLDTRQADLPIYMRSAPVVRAFWGYLHTSMADLNEKEKNFRLRQQKLLAAVLFFINRCQMKEPELVKLSSETNEKILALILERVKEYTTEDMEGGNE